MENVESQMKKSFLYKHEDFLFSLDMAMEKGLFYLNCSNKREENDDMISDRDSIKSCDYVGGNEVQKLLKIYGILFVTLMRSEKLFIGENYGLETKK